MFPDRIDKMVIDAVQNPHEYYHDHAYVFVLKYPQNREVS